VHVNNLALGQAASPSLVRGRDQSDQERTASERRPILVVGADADFGQALGRQLLADGYHVTLAHTAGHAAVLAAARTPCLVVLGELDPPRGALDLLEAIRRRQPAGKHGPWPPGVPVIVLSSAAEQTDLLRAFDAGADDFLARPIQYLELRSFISSTRRHVISSSGAKNRRLRTAPVVGWSIRPRPGSGGKTREILRRRVA
jgi:DNA-binding response OmpR family regulator